MNYQERYLKPRIITDLEEKMVFVGGPRQVGKTTLAMNILDGKPGYLNWDISEDKDQIMRGELPPAKLWVFDEIHKYTHWRNMIKGLYDAHYGKQQHIMVTGSARLDYYRHGGDSLQGRYHYHRLHPLSVAELGIESQADFHSLLALGGFPEPFFRQDEVGAKRWSNAYRTRLIQEDLISLETVKDINTLELMMLRLPKLVGSPLSIQALSEDLGVSHKTASHWLDIFSRLYAIFRVPPLNTNLCRALKKAQKHYHTDWTLVEDDGPRFENCIASHLLKWCHYQEDSLGNLLSCHYFRDTDGREVDFIIVENGQPKVAIECKWSDGDISKSLKYFLKKYPEVEAWQVTATGTKDYMSKEGIRVAPAINFLSTLV